MGHPVVDEEGGGDATTEKAVAECNGFTVEGEGGVVFPPIGGEVGVWGLGSGHEQTRGFTLMNALVSQ